MLGFAPRAVKAAAIGARRTARSLPRGWVGRLEQIAGRSHARLSSSDISGLGCQREL